MNKDIIVTLPKSRGGVFHLQQKIQATQFSIIGTYWEFSRLPKQLGDDSRIYVVCDGFLRGYFTISRIEKNIVFLLRWTDIEYIEMQGFQGFRYYTRPDGE